MPPQPPAPPPSASTTISSGPIARTFMIQLSAVIGRASTMVAASCLCVSPGTSPMRPGRNASVRAPSRATCSSPVTRVATPRSDADR
ncbi:Protein of unknown function [Propionibacterium freudenreichii]|nr:Protein of unknown function [Propionibacterium freudenreichii]